MNDTQRTDESEQLDGLRSAVDYACDQLTKVTEQRDRLAEALRKIAWSNNSRWQTDQANEALQSLSNDL